MKSGGSYSIVCSVHRDSVTDFNVSGENGDRHFLYTLLANGFIKNNVTMKIKAIHTAWDNKPCIIKPRFFPKETWLQFTVIEGCYSGSCFACKYEQFTFDWYAKFQIFFVRIWYYLKMNLWRKLRRQYPYRIKLFFHPIKNNDGLPF